MPHPFTVHRHGSSQSIRGHQCDFAIQPFAVVEHPSGLDREIVELAAVCRAFLADTMMSKVRFWKYHLGF